MVQVPGCEGEGEVEDPGHLRVHAGEKRNSYHLLNVQEDGMEIMLEEFGFLSLMLFDAFLICWLRRLHVRFLMTRRC